MEELFGLLARFDYNSEGRVPILPAFHGTDLPVAESIARTGFAALSSLVCMIEILFHCLFCRIVAIMAREFSTR